MKCYTPCHNPVHIPGRCCPSCAGCSFGGKVFKNGDTFTPGGDPCIECSCKKGTISCEKRACPVMNCPPDRIYLPEGSCCRKCKGSRKIYDVSLVCFFRNKIYSNSKHIRADNCTDCTCMEGTMVCSSPTCPVLICPVEQQYTTPGNCCPKCKVKPRKECRYNGQIQMHGDKWQRDVCTACECRDGHVHCTMEECNNTLKCPKGYKLQLTPDTCCPVCVEEAICTVFGDPHYRTFDGKIYNFQGRCKYVLARDCVDRTFSIKVQNDARLTSDFSWTHRVTILLPNFRVTLQQKLIVKVNRRRIKLPFRSVTAPTMWIRQEGHSVVMNAPNGMQVVWDGDSFLEITVPSMFKKKLCGLCGNYNGDPTDDLIGKKGVTYYNEQEFGDSWRTGSLSACRNRLTPLQKKESPCEKNFKTRERECQILLSDVFVECRKKVDPKTYYRSCLMDMCDCPKGKLCSCESLLAYSRACTREGLYIPQEKYGHCKDKTCPDGAEFNVCGPACARTCDNINSIDRSCLMKPCVRGCHCTHNRPVFHNGRCIPAHRCPKGKQATT
ncbi:BMP-binding endothelial regulator protein-like [Octopus sinensis]|uniref:BMP-binding endothelial regulator protein-like n=1 Tax=Octopus sinensis TaxID=2607531 RepID=A0A6P7U379_9MOLL|nr:BMP-binding endothelial regulator protein-like [Octopus sinensis]